jgi:hypothetical protein
MHLSAGRRGGFASGDSFSAPSARGKLYFGYLEMNVPSRSAIRVIVFQNSRCMLQQGRSTNSHVRVDQLHLMGRRREICH